MNPITDHVVDNRRCGKAWATRSGVIVGGAYIRPAPMPADDADKIQAALLHRPEHREPLVERLVLPVSVLTMVGVLLAIYLGAL
jgi:hypothetical protein